MKKINSFWAVMALLTGTSAFANPAEWLNCNTVFHGFSDFTFAINSAGLTAPTPTIQIQFSQVYARSGRTVTGSVSVDPSVLDRIQKSTLKSIQEITIPGSDGKDYFFEFRNKGTGSYWVDQTEMTGSRVDGIESLNCVPFGSTELPTATPAPTKVAGVASSDLFVTVSGTTFPGNFIQKAGKSVKPFLARSCDLYVHGEETADPAVIDAFTQSGWNVIQWADAFDKIPNGAMAYSVYGNESQSGKTVTIDKSFALIEKSDLYVNSYSYGVVGALLPISKQNGFRGTGKNRKKLVADLILKVIESAQSHRCFTNFSDFVAAF
ncbi:MAG: hypothetical protein JNL01_09015 [Bdellovibrionales bacterium]|nr:hypothetical protein [Bdellovibrionales bacterium]